MKAISLRSIQKKRRKLERSFGSCIRTKKVKQYKYPDLKPEEIVCSQHAFVRYFERVKGIDIQQVEKDIITDDIKNMVETLGGTGEFPHKEGFILVMKDKIITTII